jgi:K+-sensing histidine kinase KdpD
MKTHDIFSEIAALHIHDVKNNLAQLAAEAEARGDVRNQDLALRSSETLTQLLCFYRSETHNLHVQIEAQNPHELITDVVNVYANPSRLPAGRLVEIQLAQAPELWFYDANLIQMVLANALQNALRFAQKKIIISVTAQTDYLEICIQDDGNGYPTTMLETQIEHVPVSAGGTGLGLRLAHRIVALHTNNGRVGEIILSNHQGARFKLRLP